jgi:hypothetical protein
MINAGGSDHEWGAFKNWRAIEKDDRIWIYYGTADGDLGVVGLATVREVKAPPLPGRRAPLFLNFDFDVTSSLLRSPFEARRIREFVPRPMTTVWAVPPELSKQLLRHVDRAERPTSKPAQKKLATSTITYNLPSRQVTVKRRHDALLHPIRVRLESVGWRSIPFSINPKQVDLAMRRSRHIVVIEAKTFSRSSSVESRQAFAQLAEYSWRYKRSRKSPTREISQWALFERQPDPDDVEFLEHHQILVSWVAQRSKRLTHGPLTSSHVFVRELG